MEHISREVSTRNVARKKAEAGEYEWVIPNEFTESQGMKIVRDTGMTSPRERCSTSVNHDPGNDLFAGT